MKLKVALFQYASETGLPDEVRTESQAKYTSMVCVSEWVEVDFPLLAAEVAVPIKVAAIENEIARETADFANKIQRLNARKNELLAITHQPAEQSVEADMPF